VKKTRQINKLEQAEVSIWKSRVVPSPRQPQVAPQRETISTSRKKPLCSPA
jgi:hypothetical protein